MRVVILGAAGLAREMAQLLRVLDREEGTRHNVEFVDVTEEEAMLEAYEGPVVYGVGHARARLALVDRVSTRHRLTPQTLVHPRADIGDTTSLDSGVVACSGVVATTDVRVGHGALLNWNVTVGHDTVIGKACVVNPLASLSGGVTLGDGVLVGTGATVLEGLTVGAGAIIGAGAVVTKDVPPGSTVVGVPARRMRS